MSKATFNAGLKASTEALTNAEQTIIYTAKGTPSFMYVLKKFDLSTIDASLSGTHPAFIVNGVEKDAIYVGVYPASEVNGELVSQPNVAPKVGVTREQYSILAAAAGAGFHVMTNAEWAAVALQSYKANTQPLGNSYWGQSSEDATQAGRRIDGIATGTVDLTKQATILNGSGPVTWRHNRKYNGISDMAGNIWELCNGVRLFNGELQIIANNDAAISSTDLSSTSAAWKAINATTGALVAPNGSGTTAGTVKFATSGTADYTLVVTSGAYFSSITNPSTTAPVATAVINMLKALCLFPMSNTAGSLGFDNIYLSLTDEKLLTRGGTFALGTGAGIFAIGLERLRVAAAPEFGARIAYYA